MVIQVFFLFVMSKGRFTEINQILLKLIDKFYGNVFWRKCILVMTGFDDEIMDNPYMESINIIQRWFNVQASESAITKILLGLFETKLGFYCKERCKEKYSDNWNCQRIILFNEINVKNNVKIERYPMIFKRLSNAIRSGTDQAIQVEINKVIKENYKITNMLNFIPIIGTFSQVYQYFSTLEEKDKISQDYVVDSKLTEQEVKTLEETHYHLADK